MTIKSIAERALDIVRRLPDRSLLSPALRAHLGRWDVEVLLSAERANLLRPVAHLLRGPVLEVNAGAGTLTRYLGELGLAVTACEPGATLAEIVRLRCADLPNVTVQAGLPAGTFSTILATGVAPVDLLELQHLLSPNGRLLIVADNPLGLGALAGAPYPADIVERRCASRADWQSALPGAQFLYPFPDAHLPSLILTDAAWNEPAFDAATLVCGSLAGSPGMERLRSFSEEQLWPVIVRGGLAPDFAHSFLIVQGAALDANCLAFKYSTQRARDFQKCMRVERRADGTLWVLRESLAPAANAHAVAHRVLNEPYHAGEIYFDRLLDIVNRPGWTLDAVAAWAHSWIGYLQQHATSDGRLPAEFFDCLPSNLVVENGNFVSFDLEYAPAVPPTLSHVVFRGLLSSFRRLRNCAPMAEGTPARLVRLASIIAAVSDATAEQYLAAEAEFQQLVGGSDPGELLPQLRNATLPVRSSVEGALAQRRQMVEQIESYHEALAKTSAEITHLHERLAHYHQQVDELSAKHGELTLEMTDYHHKMESAAEEISRLHKTLGDYHHHILNIEAARSSESAAAQARITQLESELTALRQESGRSRQQLEGLNQPLERLRVLYISDMLSAPFRYRCENAVLQLREEGVDASLATLNHPQLLAQIHQYSVVVLFRLSWNETVARIVAEARQHRVSLVFDIDDLLFETTDLATSLPFLAGKPVADHLRYQVTARRVRQTMLACDWFIGSTPALVEAAQRFLPAFEHPNLLPPTLVADAPRIRQLTRLARRYPLIGYLSGSDTHDADFASIAPALLEVMRKNGDALLLLGGFVEVPAVLDSVKGRILRAPFVHWRVLPYLQAMITVNLAPLAQINRFTEAKSPLKFFEAAILGVPTVATPTGPLRAAIRHGKNGFLAEDKEGWISGIRACLNATTHKRLSETARDTALAQYTFAAHRGELKQLLRRFIQPGWTPPASLPALPPLHAQIHDLPSSTVAEFLSDHRERRRAVTRLLQATLSPYRLNAGEWWRPLQQNTVRVTVDPGTPDEIPGGVTAPASTPHRVTAWHPNNEVDRDTDHQFRSTGTDPYFLSDYLELDARTQHHLRIRLQLPDEGEVTFARLYWGGERNEHFDEEFTVTFPVLLDGQPHTYLVDLSAWEQGGPTRWPESGRIRILRFDPMTRPGPFHFDGLEIL